MKLVTVLGARPQFVKASSFSRACINDPFFDEIIIHTGQHYDSNMSDVFFKELSIPKPKYNLNIGSGSHAYQTGRMLESIEDILISEKPNLMVVYGDTNSTLSGALAASKLGIPIVHIEAGLRSFNRCMPEEINRILVDHCSDYLMAPSVNAIKNLKDEGLEKKGHFVGDIMFDSILYYSNKLLDNPKTNRVSSVDYILCTLHRAENTNHQNRLRSLVDVINQIHSKIPIVMPIHPRTRDYLKKYNLKLNVELIEPVGYLEMINLIRASKCVMTDSGGLQKEAFFCNKMCFTLRNETEWVELVEVGANHIIGENLEGLIDIIFTKSDFTINASSIYGEGKTASHILDILRKEFT